MALNRGQDKMILGNSTHNPMSDLSGGTVVEQKLGL